MLKLWRGGKLYPRVGNRRLKNRAVLEQNGALNADFRYLSSRRPKAVVFLLYASGIAGYVTALRR